MDPCTLPVNTGDVFGSDIGSARVISYTNNPEQVIAFCARVSNPPNQENPNIVKLLKYCIQHGHWSVFEQANVILEIECSRTIARQILRHRSFSFQEFSQRYSNYNALDGFVSTDARLQDYSNRQSSIPLDPTSNLYQDFHLEQEKLWNIALEKYNHFTRLGIAKEQARVLLPEGMSKTRMYMNGTVRSWMHYLKSRLGNGTQLEHQLLAEKILEELKTVLPTIFNNNLFSI